MNTEVLSFPPFTVKVRHEAERLQTRISFPHAKNRELVLNALAFEFVADTKARQLFFHTANSDHSDAATIYSVNIETGRIIWRVPDVPPGGPILLNPSKQWLEAGKPYGTADPYIVRVDYAGNVLVRNPRSGYEMVDMALIEMQAGNDNAAQDILQKAAAAEISPNTKAKVLKYLGEIAERAGDTATAVELYEKALKTNPKVAVKKRPTKLKRGSRGE